MRMRVFCAIMLIALIPIAGLAQTVDQKLEAVFWEGVRGLLQPENQTYGFDVQQRIGEIRILMWYSTKDTGLVQWEFARISMAEIAEENFARIAQEWINAAHELVEQVRILMDQGIALSPEDFLKLSSDEEAAFRRLLSAGGAVFPRYRERLNITNPRFTVIGQGTGLYRGERTMFFTIGVSNENDVPNASMFHLVPLARVVAMSDEEIVALVVEVLEKAIWYVGRL